MPDMENGVCVLELPNGDIVTGSTGRQQGESTIVDFQIRIWRGGDVVKQIKSHAGAVRGLDLVPGIGFVSCSNDGTVRVWSSGGDPLLSMQHSGFVLGVCSLPGGGYVSVSEDSTVAVWGADGQLQQTLQHPRGLWCVAALPNGDFVTGGEVLLLLSFAAHSFVCLPLACLLTSAALVLSSRSCPFRFCRTKWHACFPRTRRASRSSSRRSWMRRTRRRRRSARTGRARRTSLR
jgi:WD40 repeat protein